MKLTVTNDSPTHAVLPRLRQDGARNDDKAMAPGETRTFDMPFLNSSLSFLPGPEAERAAAPVAAPAAAPQAPPNGVSLEDELKALAWPELRKRAIAAGAPKTVSKADALALLLKPAA